MSESRALDTEYKESVAKRRLPENGIVVEAVQLEIEDRTLSIKIKKEEKSGNVLAVIKGQHFPITADEYEFQKSKHCSNL